MTYSEQLFETWMISLYHIALMNIGEDKMSKRSWYYTNKSIWREYYLAGYSPEDALKEDLHNVN